jgi:hypothetical protein
MTNPSLIEETYEVTNEEMAYMPENYETSRVAEVGTASVIDPHQIFGESRKRQPVPMWRLQVETKKYCTQKPISVRVYRDGEFFFAENENLAVCGTGSTLQEAIEDLALHIVHFFEYYRNMDRSQLIGDALRLKGLYQDLLIEE